MCVCVCVCVCVCDGIMESKSGVVLEVTYNCCTLFSLLVVVVVELGGGVGLKQA